jgi:hypothetical protein
MGGESFLTLNANGSGSMDGDALKWKSDGKVLTITDADGETDKVSYQLSGDTLTLSMAGVPISLQRAGGKAPKVKPQAPQAPAPQTAGGDQLSRLLLSSNWCWLRYSNGNSYTQKVHFNANGTWEDFSESDISANNVYAGTTAQATGNRTSGGQWAVKGGQLYLSSPDSPQLEPVPLTVTRNSNGYPIINADGREYSMCN